MKVVLSIVCWIFAALCCVFPFLYNHSEMDKKELKISHIVVDKEVQILDIKKQLEEGESFEELAEKYSQCPSAKQKGDIGYNMRGKLVPEFEKVAFKLKLKEVSEPVNAEESWFLIKVYDIKYFSDKENFDRRYY